MLNSEKPQTKPNGGYVCATHSGKAAHHDGDFDIIGANWDTRKDPRGAPMEMWRNLLIDHPSARGVK
ncbi:MAG: hypothetical protein ACLQVL_16615 [Terriglobia bacterium]